MKIKLLRSTVFEKQIRPVGTVFDCNQSLARQLIRTGQGAEVTAPAPAPGEIEKVSEPEDATFPDAEAPKKEKAKK